MKLPLSLQTIFLISGIVFGAVVILLSLWAQNNRSENSDVSGYYALYAFGGLTIVMIVLGLAIGTYRMHSIKEQYPQVVEGHSFNPYEPAHRPTIAHTTHDNAGRSREPGQTNGTFARYRPEGQ